MATKSAAKVCPGGDRAVEVEDRVAAYDWAGVEAELNEFGAAVLSGLVDKAACRTLSSHYEDSDLFRSRIVMARHGFGRGEYKYFTYPLPALVSDLRQLLYPPLAGIANRWRPGLKIEQAYPKTLEEWLDRCHRAGQERPTPLLLKYEAGDYNALHQDLYGEHVFPLQVAVLLSEPEEDFTGGEFVLTEQRPRMQSRAEVVALRLGDGVVFPVYSRPVAGTRGTYQVKMRHGVSRLRSGTRFTLGLIFHDAA
jgi:uncharacterized protein